MPPTEGGGMEIKMKNRKKIFIIIAVLSTFCFSICGCSKDKDKDISKKQLYASICNPNMQGVKEALKNRTRQRVMDSFTVPEHHQTVQRCQ